MRQGIPGRQAFILGGLALGAMICVSVVSMGFGRGHPALVTSAVLLVALYALSVIDIDRGLLPDWLTLPLIGLGVLQTWLSGGSVLLSALGAGLGYVVIWLLAEYWRRARGVEGIGLGDAKLLAAGGAWAGALALPGILLIASALGIAGAVVVRGKLKAGQVVRFGPFLAIGIWALWVFPLG